MGKVIGTVPDVKYNSLKEFVVECDGDWWIGSSTVYHNVNGVRAGTMMESHLSQIVTAAEFKIKAGTLTPREFTWAELLSEYEQYEYVHEGYDDNGAWLLLVCVIAISLYFMFG